MLHQQGQNAQLQSHGCHGPNVKACNHICTINVTNGNVCPARPGTSSHFQVVLLAVGVARGSVGIFQHLDLQPANQSAGNQILGKPKFSRFSCIATSSRQKVTHQKGLFEQLVLRILHWVLSYVISTRCVNITVYLLT